MTIEDGGHPTTVIIVGSGCSLPLGVPTMYNFMDTVFDKLRKVKSPEGKEAIERINNLIYEIRGSAAYVRTSLLNIEELYGLSEMALKIRGTSGKDLEERCKTQQALDWAITLITQDAGKEFCVRDSRISKKVEHLREAIIDSRTMEWLEDANPGREEGLLAYLALAQFKDRWDKHPLFIQFNWDLALDRAMCLSMTTPNPEKTHCHMTGLSYSLALCRSHSAKRLDYNSRPALARPHGGIHWKWGSSEKDTKGTDCAAREDVHINPSLGGIEVSHDTDIAIVPPTWNKVIDNPTFKAQWQRALEGLENARQILFVGYSLPKSDLYFHHFLALALAGNSFTPTVYVWNPSIFDPDSPEYQSYLDVFAPLAREHRLRGIDGKFGTPGLLDPQRALNLSRPLT